MGYKTIIRCPVCKVAIDELSGPEPVSGMAESLLGGDARRAHARESPECIGKPGWTRGWDSEYTTETDVSEE